MISIGWLHDISFEVLIRLYWTMNYKGEDEKNRPQFTL